MRWIVTVMMGVLSCSVAAPALALESASYRLYDTIPNDGTGAPDTSANYLLNENGVSWYPLPLSSTHYQIVTAPPVIASSRSSSSAASSIFSIPSQPSGGHRGTRPPPSLHPSAGRRSSRSSSSRASSIPAAHGSSSTAAVASLPAANAPVAVSGAPSPESLRPAASCIGSRCACERSWSFGGLCLSLVRTARWSWLGIVCAVLELVLLLRIFRRPHAHSRRHR